MKIWYCRSFATVAILAAICLKLNFVSAGVTISSPVLTNGNLNFSLSGQDPAFSYNILYTTNLGTPPPWSLVSAGTVGQTNYTIPIIAGVSQAFFIAVRGTSIQTNGLWLQITNHDGNFAYVNLNNATDQVYAVWTTTNLLTGWQVEAELWPTSDQTHVLPFTVPTLGQPILFVRAQDWARVTENGNATPDWWFWKYFGTVKLSDTNLDAGGIHTLLYDYTNGIVPIYSFHVTTSPLSQEVFDDDTVTFSVETGGNTNLTYQWTFNGGSVPGATNSSYTIFGTQASDAGNYAVLISDGTNSILTAAAQLTDAGGTGGSGFIMFITGPRQNYTFRSGVTYVISPYYFGSSVTLYGKTVIEGGAVLKFDTDSSTNASVKVLGDLECQSQPYNPAILTCIDDDFTGDTLEGYGVSTGSPITAPSGTGPYLDLTYATNASIQNLRVCFADQGITTPSATERLDLWDCQFLECNYGVVNLIPNTRNGLHNVLFAGCGAAVGAASNSIVIEAEQVTADVENFFLGDTSPSRISLTNSIIFGKSSFPNLSTTHVIFNPDPTNFQSEGLANYYLAAYSSLHNSGTAGISARLQTELRSKSTYAPVAFPAFFQVSGQMTLAPQAPRFNGGSPDCGYYYDVLDYTVANLVLKDASLTVLPGTAIAVENQYVPSLGEFGSWTITGFDVMQGGSVYSHATPDKPSIFTAEKQVQETPNVEFANFQQFLIGQEFDALWFDAISFVPDYQDDGSGLSAPMLDFRFCQFYMPPNDYHVWAGGDDNFGLYYGDGAWEASYDSSVDLTAQDCAFYGGRINLGNPDVYSLPVTQVYPASAMHLLNNTFDDTALNLEPTFYQYLGPTNTLNIDFAFQAYNNLFRHSPVIHLEPVPASAGNWLFKDNLFDKTAFIQSVEGVSAPLDYGYNGNYPLELSELGSILYRFGFGTNQLAVTATGDGFVDGTGDVPLLQAPPYQTGPFGNYYLPDTTPLYGAGSDTPASLGLYHYTTQTNQFKEGSEVSGHMANIGLHYVAANLLNSLPQDSDGDGIPDYVENWHGDGAYSLHTDTETDWQNPVTDGVTPDAYSTIYDNTDLDGDGLTGRAERILGTNPLIPGNPLTLIPIITGDEPFILTYSISLPSDIVASNNCVLVLMDNGVPYSHVFTWQSNNTYQVSWNTVFAAYGFHELQVELGMPGARPPVGDSANANNVLTVFGQSRFENVNNLVQFDPGSTLFGSQANIYGTLQVQSANYEIDIYDTTNNLLRTITGHTTNGIIDEVWDLTTTNGQFREDDEFDAQIYITPGTAVAASGSVHPQAGSASSPYPLSFSRLGSCGDAFTMAFGWNTLCDLPFRKDMLRLGVLDIIFSPILDNTYANTSLNCYDCDPFFMYSTGSQTMLTNDLANGNAGNFFWYGHGSSYSFGAAETDSDINAGLSSVTAWDLGNALGNNWNRRHTRLIAHHPFRLVIMEGCDTAEDAQLSEAFGILGAIHSKQWFQRHGQPSQAYVGWTTEIFVPGCPVYDDPFMNHSEHQADMFGLWMSEVPLVQCVVAGATPYLNGFGVPVPFDTPLDANWRIFGDPNLTRTPSNEP